MTPLFEKFTDPVVLEIFKFRLLQMFEKCSIFKSDMHFFLFLMSAVMRIYFLSGILMVYIFLIHPVYVIFDVKDRRGDVDRH